MLSEKEVALLYETLLSTPGMNDEAGFAHTPEECVVAG